MTAPSSSRSRETVVWVASIPSLGQKIDELALARHGVGLEQLGDAVLALVLGDSRGHLAPPVRSGHRAVPLTQASSPRMACIRLAACCQTTLWGPSTTAGG